MFILFSLFAIGKFDKHQLKTSLFLYKVSSVINCLLLSSLQGISTSNPLACYQLNLLLIHSVSRQQCNRPNVDESFAYAPRNWLGSYEPLNVATAAATSAAAAGATTTAEATTAEEHPEQTKLAEPQHVILIFSLDCPADSVDCTHSYEFDWGHSYYSYALLLGGTTSIQFVICFDGSLPLLLGWLALDGCNLSGASSRNDRRVSIFRRRKSKGTSKTIGKLIWKGIPECEE